MISSQNTRLRIRIGATAESVVRSGHPWLFAQSIREQNREGQTGELAVIFDRNDKFLAVGLFDPDSPLRVRILRSGKPQTIDRAWWQNHFRETIHRRDSLFDEQTTGFRWINGESDGWPGLVLDRYDTTLVVKLYTAAWLPRLEEIVAVIAEGLPHERLVVRLSRNMQRIAQTQFQLVDGQILRGGLVDAPVVFLENGVRFEADVLRGQKTGFFLDQRENRQRVETLAHGREVLNAFSFSGGFSLYAARGGARAVTDIDISEHALESARRNFALNKTIAKNSHHETIQADAFDWMAGNPERKFDLVILDPPSLAKREMERVGALQAYQKLAQGAIGHLRAGGILVAASCSAHVSAKEFFQKIREIARHSRHKFSELRTTEHAPDHPATFLEARYLKCIYLQFGLECAPQK
ncbi:MAG: class I SAM-dependent methyltransferase [Verrucomicrobiota bacterium]